MKSTQHFMLIFSLAFLTLYSCGPLSPMQPDVVTGGRAVSVTRHPTNNNEFIVASEGGGIFKSTNAGTNWTQVTGSNTFWFNDVKYCVVDPTIVIAVANNDTKTSNGGGIWRSTNSGNTWTQVALTTPDTTCKSTLSAYCLAVEPGNNKIWVGTTCGLAVSTDNGASFTFIPSSTNYNNDPVYAVLAPAANQIKILTDGGVKVSTNDGTSWSFSTTGLPYVAKGVHSQIACSPLNHQHIFWASNFSPYDGKWHNGIYYSADNGNTWTNLIDNLGINRPPTCYTALSLSGGANKFDLYYSDGGCTLQRASFTNTNPPAISGSWASLNQPHCDFADLSFKTDGKSPALLVGDGGIFTTPDNGANWAFTGGGKNGYNALQITEVTGQLHSNDAKSDLYYATQDNNISSSGDGGVTWPDANRFCCEGFFLNIPRESLPAGQTKFTGVDCGACFNFMAGPLLSGGVGGFPSVANATGNPRLLKPGAYIQSDTLPGAPTVSIFSLTTNNGGAWNMKYAFVNEQRDLSHVAGDENNPVVFTAVKDPGATSDGQEIVGIKKIVGVLSSGSPIVSDLSGFGSIGIFPTMFAWYKPYGADLHDPNHVIAPDITTNKVRVTVDGGATWTDDNNLTNLVTQSGSFKFRWGPFTQISNIAFDPDVSGRILVGTVQAGIFSSCDYGASWAKVAGTEIVPNVSSFYFLGNNQIVVSSYGRGLWKLSLAACPTLTIPNPNKYLYAEPLIFWKGAWIPISQIHNPDVCPVCGYFLVDHGDITEVNLSKDKNEILGISTNGGNIKGYTYELKSIPAIPFQISTLQKNFSAGDDQSLAGMLNKGYKIKGVFLEGKMFKGLIIAKEDVRTDQLPKNQEMKNYLNSYVVKDNTGNITSVRLTGKGFDKSAELAISVDGKKVDFKSTKSSFNEKGNLDITLNYLFTPGGHTILVEQKTPTGTIKEATTVIIPLNDNRDRERK
jgi:photosystem II stability/assembly factor-like uncharacterized protein